jgi:hypothetical protein
MPGVMSKAHIDGFLDEIKRVNPGFAESRSSLMGLLRQLRNSSANPAAMTLLQAKQFCVNPNDRRLVKYDAALRHLLSVWATARPYPGHEVPIGRMMFRGDDRAPNEIFPDGFSARENTGIQYRDAQQDIDPRTAVAASPSPYVAANFPLPESYGPNAFQMASNQPCWVYAFYLAEGFHTVGTQAVNAIAGAPNARTLLYAGEMASTRIPGNHILAAVAVVRQFNWVHITPRPNDWMSRGTFNFDPTRWRENAAYTGPYRNEFLPMVRTFLQDQTNRAFPH